MCVGFVSDINKARSLRNATNSNIARAEKTIIAIFGRPDTGKKYNELVYLSKVINVYQKDENLLEKLDKPIQMRFLEIITKPEKNNKI